MGNFAANASSDTKLPAESTQDPPSSASCRQMDAVWAASTVQTCTTYWIKCCVVGNICFELYFVGIARLLEHAVEEPLWCCDADKLTIEDQSLRVT